MKITNWYRTALSIAAVASLATAGFADSPQTWISGVGDDVNPCTRTAPCQTLAGAYSKTAAGGEINALDAGPFGPVAIAKSITINLTPVLGGVQAPATNGILINPVSGTINVILRGLDINGLGTGLSGIRIVGGAASTVHIEDSQIYGFAQNGIHIAPTAGGFAAVTIAHTRISECATSEGIHADATAALVSLIIVDTEVHNCGIGLNAMGGVRADARMSDFSQNFVGVSAAGSAVLLNAGTIDFCATAVVTTTPTAVIRLDNMAIMNNGTGISVLSGVVQSSGNNMIKGNTTSGIPTVIPLS